MTLWTRIGRFFMRPWVVALSIPLGLSIIIAIAGTWMWSGPVAHLSVKEARSICRFLKLDPDQVVELRVSGRMLTEWSMLDGCLVAIVDGSSIQRFVPASVSPNISERSLSETLRNMSNAFDLDNSFLASSPIDRFRYGFRLEGGEASATGVTSLWVFQSERHDDNHFLVVASIEWISGYGISTAGWARFVEHPLLHPISEMTDTIGLTDGYPVNLRYGRQ
jgi:hypothetical protein